MHKARYWGLLIAIGGALGLFGCGGGAGSDAGTDAGVDASADGGDDAGTPIPEDSIFAVDENTVAVLEFNGDVTDGSANGRDGTLQGGDFVATEFGQGLRLLGESPQGIDWDAYKDQISHPFTIEMVLVPGETDEYQRLFRYDDEDEGWYIYEFGFISYNNDQLPEDGSEPIQPDERLYIAFVSQDMDDEIMIDVYANGQLLGTTPAGYVGSWMDPPSRAVFFEDDSAEGSEHLIGVVDALRISSGSRTADEITATQLRLDARPIAGAS